MARPTPIVLPKEPDQLPGTLTGAGQLLEGLAKLQAVRKEEERATQVGGLLQRLTGLGTTPAQAPTVARVPTREGQLGPLVNLPGVTAGPVAKPEEVAALAETPAGLEIFKQLAKGFAPLTAPPSPFAKINPRHFTPESLRVFDRTRDFGDLTLRGEETKGFAASKKVDEISLAQHDKTFFELTPEARKGVRDQALNETLKEASLRGGISFEANQTKLRRDLKQTRILVSAISKMSREIITAEDWTQALPQKVRLTVGRWTKANTIASAYKDMKEMFTGVLSRTMGGERGVLTDRDIIRITNGLPQEGDTKEIAEFKLGLIDLILTTAEAGTAMKLGETDPSFDLESRMRIENLLNRLEGGRPPLEEIFRR